MATIISNNPKDKHYRRVSPVKRFFYFCMGAGLILFGFLGLLEPNAPWWVALILIAAGIGGILESREKYKKLN